MPRDRDGSFEPRIVPKRKKDVSEIESKVLALYAKGMSQRDIADTIEDIYGFEISHQTISEITDCVLDELSDWQNRPLKKMYTFLFVDCMYVTIRKEYESKNYAVYTILGYDTDGKKDILGLWLNESESKHTWMQIFDELKTRGVEDVLFISMDGVSGLEEGAKAIFKDVVVQRCIVHLIRNSIKYIPSKDYKKFTQSLKKVYGAASLTACRKAFEQFCQEWSQYPGAVDVWKRNFIHVEQLFDYGSSVRKVMYTTNAVESINSSFRKVTKKGAFPNENALLKLLYLRITELYKKWNGKGLDILGVAVWDKPEDTLEAIKQHNLPWNCIINGQEIPTNLYGILGIPCILVIDPEGTIVARNVYGDDLKAKINELLSEKEDETKKK